MGDRRDRDRRNDRSAAGEEDSLTHVQTSVTRGHGLLERFLAVQRGSQADRLIPAEARSGRILDVGCGTYPLFLTQTRFKERYGLDRDVARSAVGSDIHLVDHDISATARLPFDDSFFDVVTMLAVFEHLDAEVLGNLLREIDRVLVPAGLLVLTTPASWTANILRAMSRLRLVSHHEIDEHKKQYTRAEIVEALKGAGFGPSTIETGSFELGLNLWARARRVR